MSETITRFEVPSVQEAREGPPPIALIPIEAPSFPGLLFRTTTDEADILAHDDARLFPTREALNKHLARYPCPRGLTRLFSDSSIPRTNLPSSLTSYNYTSHRYGYHGCYAIMDTAVATSSFNDEVTLQAALNSCGGSITFSDKWAAQRTAEKFRDLVVHQKGSTVITRRQIKFTSKKRSSKKPACPITGKVDSAIAYNFKLPRHLYLLPVHQAFLNALSDLLTTLPTTPCDRPSDEDKWDGFNLSAWDGNLPPKPYSKSPATISLANYRMTALARHPTKDPTLDEQANLSSDWCSHISDTLTSLRKPFTPSRGYYSDYHPVFQCGCFRTPLVYINRHRRREALVALSLYHSHFLNLQTYPPPCDRLRQFLRDKIAAAHFKLSVSLASFCLALHCKDFPSYNTEHLLPPPVQPE